MSRERTRDRTPPWFGSDIEGDHRRLSADEWDEVYVVGDVHGCLSELESLLSALAVGPDDLVVFVGDLVRKGPASHEVVALVSEAPNMLSVRGNNEQKIVDGIAGVPDLTEADREWIASCPLAVSWEETLVVHGGVDPHKRLGEQSAADLLTTRSLASDSDYEPPYWFEAYAAPPRIFFGHTVARQPIVRAGAVGLDTGCVYGGRLTAYDWRRDAFVTVNADGARSRDASEIVEPERLPSTAGT